jgi:hypothetical protein
MTQPKPLPTISRCACNLAVDSLEAYMGNARVWCYCGWKGPWRKSRRGAIAAWNKVMGAPARLRREILDRLGDVIRRGDVDDVYDELDKLLEGK